MTWEYRGQILYGSNLNFLLSFNSETELEQILTRYTRHNKSASIFLGAKSAKKKRETRSKTFVETLERNIETDSRQFPLKHSHKQTGNLVRPKSWRRHLKKENGEELTEKVLQAGEEAVKWISTEKSKPPSDRSNSNSLGHKEPQNVRQSTLSSLKHSLKTSTPSATISHSRHLSAGDASSDSSPVRLSRTYCSSINRPNSSPVQRNRIISAVCAYTGTNEIMKYCQGIVAYKVIFITFL